MALRESQRRVIERRIQQAGPQEQRGISAFLGGAQEGFAQAPDIQAILAALSGPSPQDIELAQQATFGGIATGLQPQLQRALEFARAQAASRGLSESTINAALQAQAVPGVLAPAFGQAGRQFAGLLSALPFQRAQALQGIRGQASTELEAALQRGLQERGQNVTTTERTFTPQQSLLSRIAGAGLGILGGAFLGPLGAMLGSSLGGALGGGATGAAGALPQLDVGLHLGQSLNPRLPARAGFSQGFSVPSPAAPVPRNV